MTYSLRKRLETQGITQICLVNHFNRSTGQPAKVVDIQESQEIKSAMLEGYQYRHSENHTAYFYKQ